ncbi:MAG TPA: MarR family transcriptional regulator [Spirochaetota bacterium]|nr:MarR family transcriptional regulator [Spirochaetota bacterium]HNT12775.1 MarR family transcriptional regulator [Spirochaetota bacterium]
MDIVNVDPQDCPYYLLTRASLAITAAFRKAFAGAGVEDVRPAYLGALMCLWRECCVDEALGKFGGEGGMRLADLGRCAGLEPSTMTGLIDRMERDGLVRREDDRSDRRVQRIVITEKGDALRAAVMEAVTATLRRSFDGIDMNELDVFKKVLRTVLSNANRGESNE